MRELFNKSIDWDALGSPMGGEYSFKIVGGELNKAAGRLTIEVELNFVLPLESEMSIVKTIKDSSPGVNDVKVKCIYSNLIQNPQSAVRTFLPKMISMANGEYRAMTENIELDSVRIEEDKVYFGGLGKYMCERLNTYISPIFKRYMREYLGYDYTPVFINNEEACLSAEKKIEAESIAAIESNGINQNSISNETKAASNSPLTPRENSSKKTADSPSKGRKRNDFLIKRKEKELPVVGNAILGGKAVVGDSLPISDIDPAMKEAITEGTVFYKEKVVFNSGSTMAKLYITDKKDSLSLKTFVSNEKWEDIDKNIEEGDYIRVKGQPKLDMYENNELVLWVDRIEKGKRKKREDNYKGKHRVELHCHSKMSRLDGLNEVSKLIETAAQWNQPAVAITDHGVVQGFPDARQTKEKIEKKGKDIKVIYGMEGYIFDDRDCILEDGSIDYKSKNTNHIILLARNQDGLKNLYKLVSLSHLNYFYKRPRLPKSLIKKYREGLIIGSACEAGEVYRGILENLPDREIEDIASFYDYLEVQPLINNQFMIDRGIVNGREDLRELNRRVIALGDKLGKPVCATTDAHYDEPESAVYRNVMLGSMGFDNAENGQGLYLRTTEEMLEEFSYLGEELAYKIVVENTNRIADMIEGDISPIPSGKYPPVIENSDEILRTTCMKRAKEIYGDPLPDVIEDRLKTELDSIISNKYSVMYVSAQMLVSKSLQDGYMVGSRGSVGSSLAATMAGITEVNPLDPHYICPECKHIEWGDRNKYECGLDMPPKNCPNCNTLMKRDGFTIPFATFLGFDGTKEPDIDLNFAGEYQATAHRYVGEIFGDKNVFKAGTVSTLEEKNAERMVSKFTEKTGISYGKMESKRLAMGCQGVKNTTGQHPGGIIIIPDDHEIYEFCPIQHPANKDVDIITTHFDYHKLHDNLMKLDILGHTGPSMFRHLYDMTGINPMDVDITDRDVLSIFNSTDALDIKDPEYRYEDGTFGIPEFGTHFVRGMLQEIKPKYIADLVRIAGFSHGTDVWSNNAQEYINSGIAAMNEVISTRDDIMNYLILKGIENKMAFDIMEDVRKNRPLKEEQLKVMKEHGVPDWYVESCKKIQYMFPRAHAAAYVMTSMRMAWYKVYRPKEFYAAHFTASVDAFETATIMKGPGACLEAIRRIENRGNADTDYEKREKDKKTKPVYETAYEMYSRGYKFRLPVLGKSHPLRFTVWEGEVLLPYVALEGVGEAAAKSVDMAYSERPFSTVEDAIARSKINKTAVESLQNYDVFRDMPERDQISFF